MKFNKSSFIMFAPALFVVFAGLFYWFEYRPIEIRKDCSWTSYTVPAKEASAGITKDEAEQKNKERLVECQKSSTYSNDGSWESLNEQAKISDFCNLFPVKESTAIPAEPERTAWRQSTDREYERCLRNNGL